MFFAFPQSLIDIYFIICQDFDVFYLLIIILVNNIGD